MQIGKHLYLVGREQFALSGFSLPESVFEVNEFDW
jgi:hypothetical protein